MSNFIFIFLCLLLGMFFRIRKILPEGTAQVLNRFVIYIALPALTIRLLHQVSIGVAQLPAILMPWFLYLLGVVFFLWVQRIRPVSKKSLGALILTGSLGNTSFVGFPLLEALYGTSAISTGILVDQPGTFLVAGTLGILTASIFSSQTPSLKIIVQKVFLFPPFQAVLLSVFLRPIHFSPDFENILEKLAATLIPLSLVSVGFQLKFDREHIRRDWRLLVYGLGFKMILAPLLFSFLAIVCLKSHSREAEIVLVESAMAPMITAGIIATEYGLDAELASLMIGVGIPLSLITVPLWSHCISLWWS